MIGCRSLVLGGPDLTRHVEDLFIFFLSEYLLCFQLNRAAYLGDAVLNFPKGPSSESYEALLAIFEEYGVLVDWFATSDPFHF